MQMNKPKAGMIQILLQIEELLLLSILQTLQQCTGHDFFLNLFHNLLRWYIVIEISVSRGSTFDTSFTILVRSS